MADAAGGDEGPVVGRRRRWVRELPLILGVALGAVLQYRLGRAWVLDGWYEGYRWPDYVYNAWVVDLRRPKFYDAFRNPLHGALLAAAGDATGSYADGAVLVSSGAVLLMIVGAALAGRALGGPWAGAAAAVAVPLTAPMAEASRWANLYPLLAGTSTLALGLAACALRWPGPATFALAGAGGGLAWATDPRGVPSAAIAAAAVLVGARRGRDRGARVVGAGLVLAAAGLALGPALEQGFGVQPGHRLGLGEYVEEQRRVIRSWMDVQNDDALAAACRSTRPEAVFTVGLLRTPCGREMVRHNLEVELYRQLAFPVTATWAGALLLLLPGRRGLRASVDGGLVAGGAVAYAWLGILTMPLVERYGLQAAGPLVALAPAGATRLVDTLARGDGRGVRIARAVAHLLVAAMLLGLAWRERPARLQVRAGGTFANSPENRRWNGAARLVASHLPEGAGFLDCGGHAVNVALQPRRTYPEVLPDLFQDSVSGRVAEACAAWIAAPSVRPAYVGVAPDLAQGTRFSVNAHGAALAESVAAHPGWTLVAEEDGYRLYRWVGPG